MSSSIDVVIPVAAKDLPKLAVCIARIVTNSLTPIRTIYLVAPKAVCQKNIVFERPVIWVDEATYPFTLDEIKTRLRQKKQFVQQWFLVLSTAFEVL